MKKAVLSAAVTAGVLLGWPQSAAAAVLVTPTSIGYVGTAGETYPTEANLINGTGLSAAPTLANYTTLTHASAVTDNAWVTTGVTGDYFAQASQPTVVFNLAFDQAYDFTDFVYWGYAPGGTNSNEARQFKIDFSTNGGTSYPSTVTVESPLSTYAGTSVRTLALGGTFRANAARLTFLDNHFGGTANGGDRVGLGELRLIGTAVPEPTSVALLGGLVPVALLRRRRCRR